MLHSVIIEHERAEIDREGFITSGDVGYLDDGGYLFLCDRKRDMVISGGVNIYPAEIENTLIGIGSIILNGAKIGKNCLVGANSLITEGKEIPDNSLVLGAPAKVVRASSMRPTRRSSRASASSTGAASGSNRSMRGWSMVRGNSGIESHYRISAEASLRSCLAPKIIKRSPGYTTSLPLGLTLLVPSAPFIAITVAPLILASDSDWPKR